MFNYFRAPNYVAYRNIISVCVGVCLFKTQSCVNMAEDSEAAAAGESNKHNTCTDQMIRIDGV